MAAVSKPRTGPLPDPAGDVAGTAPGDYGTVQIRCYAELNDFLPAPRRYQAFDQRLHAERSVKDLLESVGVPHPEVDLILVNGESVDFDYRVRAGDRISAFPVFEAMDISPVTRLRPRPLRHTRFIADGHLGRLAAYLRMLGFDTRYRNDFDDPLLAGISVGERRILLTCDRQLLMRRIVTHGYFVRSRQPREQLDEVLARLDLYGAIRPFTRCMHCNGLLEPVAKAAIESSLPPRVRAAFNEFRRCPDCGKLYWKGSHYQRMHALVQLLLEQYRRD